MEKKNKNKSSSGLVVLTVILIILIIIAGGLLAMKIVPTMKEVGNINTNVENSNEEVKPEVKEPKTFAGNERPIAFMIDNHINAMPQAGLEQADIVYEIIVEGGETRLMIVMKNKKLDQIGPLRSARHYFLDYALENDAIYVHYGQSPQAKSDISKLSIADINGINESTKNFWRVSSRYAPHNAVTSTERINAIIKRENYRTTSSKGNVLNYVGDEFDLPDIKEETSQKNTNKNEVANETGEENQTEAKVTNIANTVIIPYSSFNTVKYTYNKETKTYTRYSRDKKQTDWNTGKTVTTKNIIITKCKNTTLNDGSGKGRQTLDGYYITNGKYIPITCEKTSRSSKTIYRDLDGNEIKVNDGKTFIQICPINSDITFK